MNNKLILLVILLVGIIFLVNKSEGFDPYYKRYCPSCGWRSRGSCSKCTNCGYCINKYGIGSCVPGDSQGPYYRRDCKYWEYGVTELLQLLKLDQCISR